MRRISVGRWRVSRARELSLARLAVFQVSIPRQSRGFSFGATQSGFSLSLHSGISPLCEYLTKSEPLQLGKLRYCNRSAKGRAQSTPRSNEPTVTIGGIPSLHHTYIRILNEWRVACSVESRTVWLG
jgi:hypothetical protein